MKKFAAFIDPYKQSKILTFRLIRNKVFFLCSFYVFMGSFWHFSPENINQKVGKIPLRRIF